MNPNRASSERRRRGPTDNYAATHSRRRRSRLRLPVVRRCRGSVSPNARDPRLRPRLQVPQVRARLRRPGRPTGEGVTRAVGRGRRSRRRRRASRVVRRSGEGIDTVAKGRLACRRNTKREPGRTITIRNRRRC